MTFSTSLIAVDYQWQMNAGSETISLPWNQSFGFKVTTHHTCDRQCKGAALCCSLWSCLCDRKPADIYMPTGLTKKEPTNSNIKILSIYSNCQTWETQKWWPPLHTVVWNLFFIHHRKFGTAYAAADSSSNVYFWDQKKNVEWNRTVWVHLWHYK